jgi:hypothetical protein
LAYASLKTRRSFVILSPRCELNKFLAFPRVLFNNYLKLNWYIELRNCLGGSRGTSGPYGHIENIGLHSYSEQTRYSREESTG